MTQENNVATWIYVVHLARPEAVSSPTEEESAAIDRHFAHLQRHAVQARYDWQGPRRTGHSAS
jgi:hypothetical protein